jgi:AcrR family transcriptional regulator
MSRIPSGTASTTRERLLDAAESVVVSEGAGALTLDAVSAQAGVSKGGLLYHFGTKDDLLEGMIDRMIETHQARTEAALERSPEAPGRYAAACVDALVGLPPAELQRFHRLSNGLLAAVTANPRLLDRLREVYRETFRRLAEDGLPPGQALAAFAIVDSFWFWQMFQFPEPDAAQTAAALGVVRQLLQPAAPAPAVAPIQPNRRRVTKTATRRLSP